MKRHIIMFLSVLWFTNLLNAQNKTDHLFIYKSALLPYHSSENQLELNLGYYYKEGVNFDASYSFNKLGFVALSFTADIFSKTKYKNDLIFDKEDELYKYRVKKNNYSLSTAIGIYKKHNLLHTSLLGGFDINFIDDNIQFIKPKGNDITYTKTQYISPFVQGVLMLKFSFFTIGAMAKFSHHFYGDIKSYNSFFNDDYIRSNYQINSSFNLESSLILGCHKDNIGIYFQLGTSRLRFRNHLRTNLLYNHFINIKLKYHFSLKTK